MLTKRKNSDERRKHDPDRCPHRITNGQIDGNERFAQQIEADDIPNSAPHRWPELREAIGDLHHGSGEHLEQDGSAQKEIPSHDHCPFLS